MLLGLNSRQIGGEAVEERLRGGNQVTSLTIRMSAETTRYDKV